MKERNCGLSIHLVIVRLVYLECLNYIDLFWDVVDNALHYMMFFFTLKKYLHAFAKGEKGQKNSLSQE